MTTGSAWISELAGRASLSRARQSRPEGPETDVQGAGAVRILTGHMNRTVDTL